MSRRVLVTLSACLILVSGCPTAQGYPAPDDPGFAKQFGPQQMGAPDAWTKSTGKDVIVAVVDSGVDLQHPEFKGKLVVLPGSDVADGDDNPDDDSDLKDGGGKLIKGHGTAGAGVIGAVTNNGVGIAGVAPDAKIMPIKAFPSKGSSLSFASVPNAIRFAVDNGAKVINLSLGTLSADGSLVGFVETPCLEALQRGALCVLSSGNARSERTESGYGRDINALVVTANDKDGKPAAFAQNADTKWSVSAGGVAVYTTVPIEKGDYDTVNGTSFSAPNASGVAALLFAQGLSVQQVVQRMLDTAQTMGDPTRNGAGLVDAAAAVGVPRTAQEGGEAEQGSGGSVLLPKAATRQPRTTTSAPARAAVTQPKASGGAQAPGAAAPTETTPAAQDPDFAADLATASSDEEQGLATGPGNDEDSAGDLAKYTLMTLAGVLLLGTGVSTLSQVRRRRLA